MMDHDKKLVLAKAKNVVSKQKESERQAEKETDASILSAFVGDLDRLLARGITVSGTDNVDLLVRTTEKFGQRVSELLNEIRTRTASLDELTIPDTIELKQITDPKLLDALQSVGDNGELVSKIQSLDQTISVLREVIKETKSPRQGQKPEDYIPVRVVDDIKGKLGWLTQTQVPTFVGGGSTGLTDAELRASPVPVSASIDTTGLATEAKQDATISAIGTIVSKATDAYSIAAISDDGTYKYFWFEDASLNYYIMRKTIASSLFEYTKGTGGYSAVYQSSILGPSGSPTWASYGATF